MTAALRLACLAAALAWAVWQDVTAQKLPNALTVSTACAGLALALLSGREALADSLIGFFAALAAGMLLWALGTFRAGDAKLYAALGALMGWRNVLSCFVWSLLLAAAAGLLLLLVRGSLGERAKRVWSYLKSLLYTRRFTPYVPQAGTERELPMAPFIALGELLTLCPWRFF